MASSLCGVLRFRGFVLVRRECVRVGGDRNASLALGLTRPVCRTPVPVGRGVPRFLVGGEEEEERLYLHLETRERGVVVATSRDTITKTITQHI